MKKEAKEQLCQVSCASDMLVAPPLFISHSDFSFDICPVNALPTFGDLSKVPYLILTFLFLMDLVHHQRKKVRCLV